MMQWYYFWTCFKRKQTKGSVMVESILILVDNPFTSSTYILSY